jgi:hypothetical protein
MELSELKNHILSVYLSPICGCKKPSLWIENANEMIKLASFVSSERAQLFIEYWEEKGIPIDTYDFEEGISNDEIQRY